MIYQKELLTSDCRELQGVYHQLDLSIARLKMATGIRCLEGCGACCLRPSREIESSVLEMIPLALRLHAEGTASEYHGRAESAGGDGRCILFEPKGHREGLGQCGRYDLRPLVCRLFGSSAWSEKSGKLRLTASKVMKESDPGLIHRAEALLSTLEEVPLLEVYGRKVASLHPGLSSEKFPLNTAIAKALEWTGLRLRWSGNSA